MWQTPKGERVLKGAEAALFREALGTLVDLLRDDEDGSIWHFDIPVFDTLQQRQKLVVLAWAARALLCEEEPAPKPTAILEGTVAVIYQHLRERVRMEIEGPEMMESPTWRELILAACREREIREDLPEADCEDVDEWEFLIDCLAGEVLWDEDWQEADQFLDADPEASRKLKRVLGIDQGYYTAIPPDPTDEETGHILGVLRRLVQGET